MLNFASICPHPPIIIPTIGRPTDLKKVSKTILGMKKLAEIFKRANPETILVISPHGPVNFNSFTINQFPTLTGHFYNFGDFQTKLFFKNDLDFIKVLEKECQKQKIPLRSVEVKELDHGTLVPLYYLIQNWSRPNLDQLKIVPIAFSYLDLKTHFEFGKAIYSSIMSHISHDREKCAMGIVASGDLSHRLTLEAPAGFSPRGKEFDEKLVNLLKKKDVDGILNLDPDLVEEAGECGLRSIIILLGALDGLDWQPEILSYEGPFGVGYLVANFKF